MTKEFKIYSLLFIFLSVLLLVSCKKQVEYEKIYYLDREDNLVYTQEYEKGKKLEETDLIFLSAEEGAYYKWDYNGAKEEYDLDNVNDVVWIYGDKTYVDVEYKVYYNNELVKEETLKYDKDLTLPDLPKYANVLTNDKTYDKSNNYVYKCEIKITYEIKEPAYKVSFYDNGDKVLDDITYEHGDTVVLPTYEKEGYIFEGWFLDEISMTEYKEISADMRGNVYLYARFTESVVHNRITLPQSQYHFTGTKQVATSIAGVYTTQPVFPSGVSSSVSAYDWSSSDEHVMTVSKYSSITAKSPGYAILTATQVGNSNVFINAIFKVTSDGVVLSNEEEANTINVYTVTFKGMNDDVIATKNVIGGGNVIYPVPKTYEGYSFIGWDKDNYNINSDIVITAQYSNTVNNQYVGKKFSVLGDSISTYQDYIPAGFSCFYPYPTADVNDYNQTWWMQTINRLGGTLFLNNSYSGSCVAHESNSSTYKQDRLDYLNVQGQYADVCMILMGANDAASSSISSKTFDERYRIMIDLLQNMAPDMELVLLTLPISKLYSAERRIDFNNIIKNIASDYNLKIIDLGNVDISNDLCDSAHPYKSGMTIIANALVDGFEK